MYLEFAFDALIDPGRPAGRLTTRLLHATVRANAVDERPG